MDVDLYSALNKVVDWVDDAEWKAYDPFDGLSSKFARYLTFGNPFLKIVLQQSVRRFPINLRKILGVNRATSSKGMGFFAQGFMKLYETTVDDKFVDKAKYCLNWLIENQSRGYSGSCWGNHFDYQSRGGQIPLGVPTVVWTGLIGHAFLDGYDLLSEKQYFDVADSACEFILNDLERIESDHGFCFNYTPNKKNVKLSNAVHNANMIGAGLLARVYHHTKEYRLKDIAREAVKFTINYQLEDGGWHYGVGKKYHWVDSFHTGYVLEALHNFSEYCEDDSYSDNLRKGFDYYIKTFFKRDGTPNYYDYKTFPLDIQCASQGIQTLVNLRSLNTDAVRVAKMVARWAIENMFDDSGFFYYRKYPVIINKTPTFHWGQATMFAALALLYKCAVEDTLTVKMG